MDVVILCNGLGNQMSQYALFLAKKRIHTRTTWLYFPDKVIDQHNGYELEKIFGIKQVHYQGKWLNRIYSIVDWSQRRNGKKRRLVRFLMRALGVRYYRESDSMFDERALKHSHAVFTFLWGGWHGEKYIRDVQDEVRKAFSFDMSKLDATNRDLLSMIHSTNSIAMHIRRGDYVNHSAFAGICTKEYYDAAVTHIRSQVSNPQFFLFSDDPEWVKENYKGEDFHVVSANRGENAWIDMFLMSQCKHNINANSTFSWWAAWLNSNPSKIVLVPERFNNLNKPYDIYPEEWIKLKS